MNLEHCLTFIRNNIPVEFVRQHCLRNDNDLTQEVIGEYLATQTLTTNTLYRRTDDLQEHHPQQIITMVGVSAWSCKAVGSKMIVINATGRREGSDLIVTKDICAQGMKCPEYLNIDCDVLLAPVSYLFERSRTI